jgi:hypothetical protein
MSKTKEILKKAAKLPLPELYKVGDTIKCKGDVCGAGPGATAKVTELKPGLIYRAVFSSGEKSGQEFLIEESEIK